MKFWVLLLKSRWASDTACLRLTPSKATAIIPTSTAVIITSKAITSSSVSLTAVTTTVTSTETLTSVTTLTAVTTIVTTLTAVTAIVTTLTAVTTIVITLTTIVTTLTAVTTIVTTLTIVTTIVTTLTATTSTASTITTFKTYFNRERNSFEQIWLRPIVKRPFKPELPSTASNTKVDKTRAAAFFDWKWEQKILRRRNNFFARKQPLWLLEEIHCREVVSFHPGAGY